MTAWYALGVALVIVGAISGGFGMNLIKASSKLEIALPWYYRKRLMLGLFLSTVFNTCLDLVSFALTPLSVIAPLGGVSIIAACIFSSYGVGGSNEIFTKFKTVGIAMVVVGIGLVAAFGPRPKSTVLDVETLFVDFTATPFCAYQIVTLLVLSIISITFALELMPHGSLLMTMVAAFSGGLASGLCQSLIKLFAACVADFTVHSNYSWIHNPLFTLAVVELACTGILLFILLKTTIESGPNISVSTTYYSVCVMLSTIAAGAALYRELGNFGSPWQFSLFFLGIGLVLKGVVSVSMDAIHTEPRVVSTKEDKPVAPVDDEDPIIE
jgi:hypothetical protein